MSYPFVAAKYFSAGAMTQPRAVVIHHAEGGGTVGWLTHPTNDNSSHFVVEYSGRVVQMVKDGDASHSLHIARPYGPPGTGDFGTFSLDAAKAVLGSGIADPNRYLFAVEIEGYAATGPNWAQVAALTALVNDLRARHPSIVGLLGHRDFQNVKACPGGHIPWATLGGHGLFAPLPATDTGGAVVLTPGKLVYLQAVVPTVGKPIRSGTQTTAPIIRAARTGDQFPKLGDDGAWFAVRIPGNTVAYVLHADGAQIETPEPVPDAKAAVDAAYNLGRDAVVNASASVPRR